MRRVWLWFQSVVFVTNCSALSLEDNPMNGSQIKVPKCCEEYDTYSYEDRTCTLTNTRNKPVNYDHYYFESNETHINTDGVKFTPIFYKKMIDYKLECFPVSGTGFLGFIFNSSLIEIVTLDRAYESFIPPSLYCVYEENGSMAFIVCSNENSTNENVIVVYLPFLILSTLCYFLSAFVYSYILKVTQVQKRCFIGYAFSMGVTFTFLIILQTLDAKGGCDAIGAVFFFSILSSFVWLACLCFELILMVWNFKEDTTENRLPIYLLTSLVSPLLILLLSMIPHFKPDVPDSFMKGGKGNICRFEDASMLYFFIAIGVLMVSSLIFLGYNFYLMGRMETKYRNHFSWLEHKSKFKYMSISCSLIWLTSAIWIIDTAVRNFMEIGNHDVLDVIEALQGIFAVAIFVTDRYTRREIYQKLTAGSDTNPKRRPLRTIRWITKKFSSKPETSTETPAEERVRIE